MPIQFWQCCDKNKAISNGANCRACGKSRPQYGVLDDQSVIKDDLTTGNEHKNANNRKLTRLPAEKEGELFISTFNKETD